MFFRQTWDCFSLMHACSELGGKTSVRSQTPCKDVLEWKLNNWNNWPRLSGQFPTTLSVTRHGETQTHHASTRGPGVQQSSPAANTGAEGNEVIITNPCRLWVPWRVYSHLLMVESILSFSWFPMWLIHWKWGGNQTRHSEKFPKRKVGLLTSRIVEMVCFKSIESVSFFQLGYGRARPEAAGPARWLSCLLGVLNLLS